MKKLCLMYMYVRCFDVNTFFKFCISNALAEVSRDAYVTLSFQI